MPQVAPATSPSDNSNIDIDLCAGYQIGVLNTALPNVVKGVHYNNEAVLSSAVVLGAALGALIAGQLADKLGPKRAQIVNCIPFITGAIFSSVAPYDYWGFLLGRLLSGFGE